MEYKILEMFDNNKECIHYKIKMLDFIFNIELGWRKVFKDNMCR